MIDPQFDPLRELVQCQNDIKNLYKNINELAKAFNSQAHLLQQLINNMAELQKTQAEELCYRDLIEEMDKIQVKKQPTGK